MKYLTKLVSFIFIALAAPFLLIGFCLLFLSEYVKQ